MTVLRIGWRGRAAVVLQGQLADAGYDVGVDGDFGDETDRGVRAFQSAQDLDPDGVAGDLTQAALVAVLSARAVRALRDYRGSWGFLLDEEGHEDAPHWPGGQSGVTLPPGLDLGFQRSPLLLRRLYGGPLLGRGEIAAEEFDRLEKRIGLRGAAARDALPALSAIQIPRLTAADILPRLAAPYWRDVARRCPALLDPSAPRAVHTALLSLCFNAGADDLNPLREHAARGDWAALADQLALLTPALAERRAREAALIA